MQKSGGLSGLSRVSRRVRNSFSDYTRQAWRNWSHPSFPSAVQSSSSRVARHLAEFEVVSLLIVATARVLCRGLLHGHNRTNPRHGKHAVAALPLSIAQTGAALALARSRAYIRYLNIAVMARRPHTSHRTRCMRHPRPSFAFRPVQGRMLEGRQGRGKLRPYHD